MIDYYDDKKWGRSRIIRVIPFRREKVVLDLLKEYRQQIHRFLDVGCGDGYFMELMKNKFDIKEIVGIDSSNYKNKHKRTQEKIIMGNIEIVLSKKFSDRYFDCLYLGEVIEHMYNPDLLIRNCVQKLKRNGLLVLSTPNLNSWYNRILFIIGFQPIFYEVSTENSNIGYGFLAKLKRDNLPVGHLRIFNIRSIKELLQKEGFDVITIKGSCFESFPKPLKIIDQIIGSIFVSLSSDLIVLAKKK